MPPGLRDAAGRAAVGEPMAKRDAAGERYGSPVRRSFAVLGMLLLGALAISVGGRLALPLPGAAAPQSAQTLAVLVVGVLLGARCGAASGAIYLLLGAAGLPVFADGAAGPAVLVGPTAGFLLAFPPAAAFAGWWRELGRADRFPLALAGMALAHVGILVLGWARIAVELGAAAAFEAGVRPFLAGAVVKSVVAAVVAAARQRRQP